MRHCHTDYDAIQPWPTKRPHIANVQDRRDGTIVGKTPPDYDPEIGLDGDVLVPIIPDDEPVFLIRAKDIVGPRIVELWAHNARSEGADPDLCDRVLDWANEMQEYARTHYDGGKIPDTPEGALR